jgi:hypothetical protein
VPLLLMGQDRIGPRQMRNAFALARDQGLQERVKRFTGLKLMALLPPAA